MHKHTAITAFSTQATEARRLKGITQSELASAIACKQSAISMFERGNTQALAIEKREAMARYLDIPRPPSEPPVTDIRLPTVHNRYCPHFDCPANVPYIAANQLFVMPRNQTQPQEKYCRHCGEVCETHCPACKAPYRAGACCSICGSAYIHIPPSEIADRDTTAWVTQQHHMIRQLQ